MIDPTLVARNQKRLLVSVVVSFALSIFMLGVIAYGPHLGEFAPHAALLLLGFVALFLFSLLGLGILQLDVYVRRRLEKMRNER